MRERKARMLSHVTGLAMDRNDDLGPYPVVHLRKLGAAGMSGHVDMSLPLGDDDHTQIGQRIHDSADRRLVPGYDLRREDDRVTLGQLDVVIAERDAAEGRALLTLPARRHDKNFLARKSHRSVEVDRLWEVLEVAGGLCDPD